MGARPHDFDERLVRESPTFKKWLVLNDGQKLRYACRDFIKGHGEDEERLMRRIMIARRNNLRDHEILKQARAQVDQSDNGNSNGDSASAGACADEEDVMSRKRKEEASEVLVTENNTSIVTATATTKRRRCATTHSMTDEELRKEMDTPAIEATRSYKAWLALSNEKEFTYNQKYLKGREGHDWLLRKNIWRRMRYRRHNKVMVDKLKHEIISDVTGLPVINDENVNVGPCSSTGIGSNAADMNINANTTYNVTLPGAMHISPSIMETNTTDHDDNASTAAAAAVASYNHNSSMTMNAALTATQIVDQTLLATNHHASSETTQSSDHTIRVNLHHAVAAQQHHHLQNGNEEHLHAAVVEAAVAAVAAAESYVNQARESETAAAANMMSSYSNVVDGSMNLNMNHTIKNDESGGGNHHHGNDASSVQVHNVHNPIISDPTQDHHESLENALVGGRGGDGHNQLHHLNHHTPNPLVGFDGDALDVAAKLAAAASVQVCKMEEAVDHNHVDRQVTVDEKDSIQI